MTTLRSDSERNAFDLVVIGGGSGGVRAARVAAEHGARVLLCESGKVGGTCVHAGCVPKKLLVYAARVGRALRRADRYGFDLAGRASLDWSRLRAAVRAETSRLGAVYEQTLVRAGVQLMRGRARLLAPDRVGVGEYEARARYVLVATGGYAVRPAVSGAEHGLVSDDVFELEDLPRSIVIVGGGYIALELAGVLSGLSSEVTLVHRGELPLSGFDQDVRAHVARELVGQGIVLELNETPSAAERTDRGLRVTLRSGRVRNCDALLFATGRSPRTADIGLEAAGVRLGDRGEILVDKHGRSSVPSVFAVGDVTDEHCLTPFAIAQGHAFADTLFGGLPRSARRSLVPTAVFSEPEVAMVGVTEQAARAASQVIDVYRTDVRPLASVLGQGPRALVKLIVRAPDGLVIGCHVVGEGAAEIVQGVAAAMTAGVTKDQLDQTLGIHPTLAEELVTLRDAAT